MLSDREITPEQALRLLNYQPSDLFPEDAYLLSQIRQSLVRMPIELRQVAEMIGVNDMRQVDVAKDLGVDQSTVSRRWKKALSLIREDLDS